MLKDDEISLVSFAHATVSVKLGRSAHNPVVRRDPVLRLNFHSSGGPS
jgi:hypothetical protein